MRFRVSILLLLACVNCVIRVEASQPSRWDLYEYNGIFDEDRCSEVAEIRDDIRALKSLVEGLRQKLDPEYKPPVNGDQKDAVQCAEGFEYLTEAQGCYKVIMERYEWSSAMEKCQSLNAHLISIDSREESEAVTKYLIKQFARRRARIRCPRLWHPSDNTAFWTSGQLANISDCSSEFVWKTSAEEEAPLNYTQWADGEPNCYGGKEQCAEIIVNSESFWNDVACDLKHCPICEYALKSGASTENPVPLKEQTPAPDESSGVGEMSKKTNDNE